MARWRRGGMCGALSVLAWAGTTTAVAAQQSAAPPVRASVSGTVYDSVGKRRLAAAVVQLVSHADVSKSLSVVADAQGRYRFDAVGAGTYILGFYHPVLDSLEMTSPVTRVDVRSDGEIRAALAIPSAATLVASICPATPGDSTGLLMGYVRSARDGSSLGNATVRVSWSEISIGPNGLQHATPGVEAATSETGGFAICGLPAASGSSVLVRAWAGSDSSGMVDLDVPAGGLLLRNLYVGSAIAQPIAVASDSSLRDSSGAPLPMTVLRGRGTLRGSVRGSNGAPIDGARVLFWGSGVEVASNANGVFRMRDLPGGTYTVEARAIGYVPIRRPVDVVEGRDQVTDFVMSPRAAYLDTVKVLGKRVYLSRQMIDFERRKRAGFGHFMDEDAIEKRNPIQVADLFRMMPGVLIAPGTFGNRVLMRGSGLGGGSYCAPTVFIDGMRVYNESGDLETVVSAQDVRALEVYTRGSSVPAEFQSMSGCGTVVIWTGGRRSFDRREPGDEDRPEP